MDATPDNASHALPAQLCDDGTATVARDAHYALVQQDSRTAWHAPLRHTAEPATLYCASTASPGALLHGARCVLGTPISDPVGFTVHLESAPRRCGAPVAIGIAIIFFNAGSFARPARRPRRRVRALARLPC